MDFPANDRIKLLTVPGIDGSGVRHWQSAWERDLEDCYRVDLGCWDDPIRNVWISRIDQAVHDARGEVILIAHSLGCQAVAWSARLLGPSGVSSVRGALLVAPPDVDFQEVDPRLDVAFPFPALVVASRDDPYATLPRSREIAAQWGAAFLDAGELAHINAGSDLADWEDGQILAELVASGIQDRSHLERLATDLIAPSKPNRRSYRRTTTEGRNVA